MMAWFESFSPLSQALLGTLLTWALTAIGTAVNFLAVWLPATGGFLFGAVFLERDIAIEIMMGTR